MSTRKLILTALICGLLIMVAGGVKLFEVANDTPTAQTLKFGQTSTLGDMTVSVTGVSQTTAATVVSVTMTGVDGANALEGWRLLAGGKVQTPLITQPSGIGVPCGTTSSTATSTCVVAFEPSDGSVTVAYVRAGSQSEWASQS